MSDETIQSIVESLGDAADMSGAGDGAFSEAASREAVSTAKIDARSVESADAALEKGKALHRAVGGHPGDTAQAAIDAYRRRAYKLGGGDMELLNDADVRDSKLYESAGLYTHPLGSPFERERRKHAFEAENKRRMASNQGRADEAARWRQRENRIKNAENESELRTARGLLSSDDRDDLLESVRPSQADKNARFEERMRRTKRKQAGVDRQ